MHSDIIKKVVVTEKAYNHPFAVVVTVEPGATKTSIKEEFKKMYGDKLEVKSVRITKLPPKVSKYRKRMKRKPLKKAYVYISNKEGFDFLAIK